MLSPSPCSNHRHCQTPINKLTKLLNTKAELGPSAAAGLICSFFLVLVMMGKEWYGEENIYKESNEKCFDVKDKCFYLKWFRREIEFGSFDETKSMIHHESAW